MVNFPDYIDENIDESCSYHSGICKCSQQDGLEKRSVRYKFNDGQVLMLKLHRAGYFRIGGSDIMNILVTGAKGMVGTALLII